MSHSEPGRPRLQQSDDGVYLAEWLLGVSAGPGLAQCPGVQ